MVQPFKLLAATAGNGMIANAMYLPQSKLHLIPHFWLYVKAASVSRNKGRDSPTLRDGLTKKKILLLLMPLKIYNTAL